MAVIYYGSVPGVEVGALFPDRRALAAAGVHRALQAGIVGAGEQGAESIVLNGGYEDDEDLGSVVIYTGHGGNDPETHKQTADQTLTRGNLALVHSHLEGQPVRVVRGSREPSGLGPPVGYRYDGLYRVDEYWREIGRSGFKIWRYRLVRDDPRDAPWLPETQGPAEREQSVIQRIVRNTAVAQKVKLIHEYCCQMCGTRLDTPGGYYAEGAHIRPLGRPHDGPDVLGNVLCLCPNHHVLFNTGAIVVRPNLNVVDIRNGRTIGQLRTRTDHMVDVTQLAFHRALFE